MCVATPSTARLEAKYHVHIVLSVHVLDALNGTS